MSFLPGTFEMASGSPARDETDTEIHKGNHKLKALAISKIVEMHTKLIRAY
jgi:hypothetical protein